MSNPLRTSEDYELFLYTITEKFPLVHQSTLTFVRKGSSLAKVAGELFFDQEISLVVRERILYNRLPAVIDWYGYEVWQGDKKLYCMTLSLIQMMKSYKAIILIINTVLQTVNMIEFLLQR